MRFERRGFRDGGSRRFGAGGRGHGGFGRSSGGFRDRDRDEPKPVKTGEEYDVEITETGSRGDGIARVNNFVVFVDGAKEGEKIRIKITDVRGRFALGQKIGAATGEPATAAPNGEATDVTTTEVAAAEDDGGDDKEPAGDDSTADEPSDDAPESKEEEEKE